MMKQSFLWTKAFRSEASGIVQISDARKRDEAEDSGRSPYTGRQPGAGQRLMELEEELALTELALERYRI